MNRKNILAFALVILIFTGCKKTSDNASKWVGIYRALPGGSINNTIDQIKVEESNSYTLRMFLNSSATSTTYVTWTKVNLPTSDSAAIAENDSTLGFYSALTYTGSGLLRGDTLKVSFMQYDSTRVDTFKFYGIKQ